jgi:hypothetical protein
MSNGLTTSKPPEVDGFDSFEDGVEGEEQRQSSGPIQGALVKFTNEAEWTTRDGEVLPADLELAAVDIARIVQKWGDDHQPIETIYLAPGQKFPDLVEMNAKIPEEWVEGPDGKKRGPWQAQHIVYLLDPATMNRYSFATGTVGGAICVRDLVDKTQWMRKFRGTSVVPVITLSDTFMNTRFGGRQRPHFLIKRWIAFGGGGALPDMAERQTLTGPTDATAAAKPPATPAKPPIKKASDPLGAKMVKEPSLEEETGDRVPW